MSTTLKAGQKVFLPFFINATDLAAATNQELIAPVSGFITEIHTVVQVAIVTGGDITVKTGDALAVTVAGLTATIPNSAAAGSRVSGTATAGSSTRAVTKGDRIAILSAAAFNGGGAINGQLVIESADTSPALPAAT